MALTSVPSGIFAFRLCIRILEQVLTLYVMGAVVPRADRDW